jgi:hypothetical protein
MEGVKIEFPERNEMKKIFLKFLNHCFAQWGATTSPAAKDQTTTIKWFLSGFSLRKISITFDYSKSLILRCATFRNFWLPNFW